MSPILGANQWNTISGKQKKTTAKGKEGISSSENTSTSKSEITVEDWETVNAQMLITAVGYTIHPNTATLDTAANAWQALKDQYDRKTPNTKTTLLKTILNHGASAHNRKSELNSEEKAHRVLKEITCDNSSTIAVAFMVSPALCPNSSSEAPPRSAWIFDSGTSAHMCNDLGQFETPQTYSGHV